MSLTLCVSQLNPKVGDLAGNAQAIITAAREAYAQGARLVVTPEMSVCGYAAHDLWQRPAFVEACQHTVDHIAQALADLPDLTVIVGHPSGNTDLRTRNVTVPQHHNTATVLRAGQRIAAYHKQKLPNYQVFDELRYFEAGTQPCVVDVQGLRVGILICEDGWFDAPAQQAVAAGAQMLVITNASPYHMGKARARERQQAHLTQTVGVPTVYAHMVGGQDEVVYDGGSFCTQADGTLSGRARSFVAENWLVHCHVELDNALMDTEITVQVQGSIAPEFERDALIGLPPYQHGYSSLEVWHALVMGVRDYVQKSGFKSVVLGLSGGIDSALVLAIAVDALGKDQVRTVMMPSPYTADISWIDARDMAERMGVRHDEIRILPMFEDFKAALAPLFEGRAEDTTEENIQARIRGTLLMGISNKMGSLVLTTGNKSELSTGYCTLYGDMAGGYAPIKDLLKTQVYALSAWRNHNDPYGTGLNPIPERIITRPPSAELRPDQTDQDSLPPYDVLDAIVMRYMENDVPVAEIVAQGLDAAAVEKVTRLIRINEYKRQQAPIGLRISHRSYGKDWRYPLVNGFRESV